VSDDDALLQSFIYFAYSLKADNWGGAGVGTGGCGDLVKESKQVFPKLYT